MIEGLLLVDKPAGISSFGVVSKVRWIITQEQKQNHIERGYCHQNASNHQRCKCKVKVGHTGTLDPAATGLLVLAIGSYTKRVPGLIKHDKTYMVTMCLGKKSTTGDKEGEIQQISDRVPGLQEVEQSLNNFVGDIMQTPPAFSAIKINGQRAYDLARKGKDVKLQPRPAKIYANTLKKYEYPYVYFESKVGSGTYIRSLVEDIGDLLKTGAHMSDLRRTAVGEFNIEQAVQFDGLNYDKIKLSLILL